MICYGCGKDISRAMNDRVNLCSDSNKKTMAIWKERSNFLFWNGTLMFKKYAEIKMEHVVESVVRVLQLSLD